MSDFLVVLAAPRFHELARERFAAGLQLSRDLLQAQPTSTHQADGVHAAVYPRRDGSGGSMAVDPATGCWLFASGTWFHDSAGASGREARLLERWLDVGSEQLARELDGLFVVVAGNARTGDVVAITDSVGSCHAFVREDPGITTISGSSLVLAGLGEEELDALGAQELIRTGSTHEGRTIHKRVRRLLGGRIHVFRDGAPAAASIHWRPSHATLDAIPAKDAPDALLASLSATAKRIGSLRSSILSDLTGGYDSRAVAAAFLSAGVPFATTVSGTPESDDVRVSGDIARAFGLDHRFTEARTPSTLGEMTAILPFTDGEYDGVDYARIFSVQRASAGQYALSVQGSGGEVARGRMFPHLLPHLGRRGPIDARPVVATRFQDSSADGTLFPLARRLDLQCHFEDMIARETADMTHLPNTQQIDAVFLALRMSNWQGRIASATDRLRRSLAPFLFRRVLDTMLSMPIESRYRSRVVREMLARHQPRLGAIALGRGYPALPFGPRTALAFRHLPGWYAMRAAKKAARMAGFHVPGIATAGVPTSTRDRLWKDDAVRAALDPSTMRLAPLFSAERLAVFLDESHRPDFAFEGAWNRMLTVESALRRVDAARRALVPQGLPAIAEVLSDGSRAG